MERLPSGSYYCRALYSFSRHLLWPIDTGGSIGVDLYCVALGKFAGQKRCHPAACRFDKFPGIRPVGRFLQGGVANLHLLFHILSPAGISNEGPLYDVLSYKIKFDSPESINDFLFGVKIG